MSGTIGGWGNLGSNMDPRFMKNTQQMMAQKLMDAGPAPAANSSQESAAMNTLNQGLRGATMPQWNQQSGKYESPDWMKWIGNQFGGGTPDATGMGVGSGTGALY
jgi:hypothetical protein